jgi:7-cyano-7-deazaguanine synthase
VNHAIVLLSGGLDSTTVATHAVREGHSVRALCVRYGQLHIRETASAEAVAAALGVPLQVVDASFYGALAWNSSLTGSDTSLPANRSTETMAADIPSTYVPIRNTFFVTLAAAVLESWVLALIEREGVDPATLSPAIYVGANAIDYSGYPDCRPEFYEAMEAALWRGSKLGAQYGVAMRIEAPIIAMGKADIVRHAVALGAPLEHTWSCYAGGERPCGTCDSCLLRAAGFAEAGHADPATPAAQG